MNLRTAVVILSVMCAVNIAFFSFYVVPQLRHATDSNCRSIHRVVVAGTRILDSPRNLRDALKAGEITRREYDQSIEQIHRFDPLRERNIQAWRSADCKP